MTGPFAEQGERSRLASVSPAGRAAAIGCALFGLAAATASAYESPDGRLRVHGHVETQLRALDESFREELDLAQWYNVLNLDIEVDLLPSGWGPIDMMSANVRVEGRYDALYSEGFRIFHSVNTYGDDARRLPKRLRDARDAEFAGSVGATGSPRARIPDERPASIVPSGERRGLPGHDDAFRQRGGDDRRGTADDPGRYVHARLLDHRFALVDFRGPASQRTRVLGPWLPKNAVRSLALTDDRANPFRGRISASALASGRALFTGGEFDDPSGVRFFDGDPQLVGFSAAQIRSFQVDPLRRGSAIARAIASSPTIITEASRSKCERAGIADCVAGRSFTDPDDPTSTFTVRSLRDLARLPLAGQSDFSAAGFDIAGRPIAAFGGDFSGILPCVDPTDDTKAPFQRGEVDAALLQENDGCIAGSFETETVAGTTAFGRRFTRPRNIRFTGGRGEAPFRPAPDLSHAARGNRRHLNAQGLYLPSAGLRRTLRSGDLDRLPFDIDETERAFNRGASQRRTKELKEAYVDIEMFDARIWTRLGLQHIVWGKTDLFRTTDQFNPQDLALSSLPTLEESRIALWSARFVYSHGNVGAVEDLRFEWAMNLDSFEPNDLGACGEPYASDEVCALTAGLVSHSYLGAGVAGIDEPESPWRDIGDLEFGGRIEWRWDRFSFALTDFYGYSDVPYADAIFYYERAVDPDSGRPVVARLPGQRLGRCARGGEVAPDPINKPSATDPGTSYSTAFASHPYSVTPAQKPLAVRDPSGTPDTLPDGTPLDGTNAIRGGVGSDPDCLRPGGAPGFANAFPLDSSKVIARTNALEHHSANQQLFAWACSTTVGIAAAIEPGACAWTIFASPDTLRGTNRPASEAFATIFAGDPDGETTVRHLDLVTGFLKDPRSMQLVPFPVASINRLFNDPQAPIDDRDGNGVVGDIAGCADEDPSTPCDLGGFDGFDTRSRRAQSPGIGAPTLDSSLTNEQRALLGCGPYYGTRCDSSARETTSFQFPQSGTFGGLDFLNMEASVLLQSWLGIEGTRPGQITTDMLPQPGTIGPLGAPRDIGGGESLRRNVPFVGGPVCTRFVERRGRVKLPGCRGVAELSVRYDAADQPIRVEVRYEAGYLPSVDGCVLGTQIIRRGRPADPVPVVAVGASADLARELPLCNGATTRRAVPEQFITGFDANGNPTKVDNDGQDPEIDDCMPRGFGETLQVNGAARALFTCNSQTLTLEQLPLIHPAAGCIASPVNPNGDAACYEWYNRDLVEEFFAGTAQLFKNELAAVSYNFLMFLAITSCDLRSRDLDGRDHQTGPSDAPDFERDPECFLPTAPYRPGRCSLTSPQLCDNVKRFFAAAGVRRNTLRAAGNSRFGRRTFIWHSGGEVVLRYDQRNVLGFAMDFAEDVTKTSWGIEATWIEGVPHADADEPLGITESDVWNLTVSIDRPTFLHFLNPNRSFFFNTQWFFTYLPNYRSSFTSNGPLNAIATFTIATGYYQDRVNPQLLTVYDFRSRSGGLLPSLQYRFTDSFSATVGLLWFFGRTELAPMPLQEIAPASNRAGRHAYTQGVDNGFSGIRRRDEVYLRLRWAF